jgi:pimeloyl-ACP methyl ester carboxylesterase
MTARRWLIVGGGILLLALGMLTTQVPSLGAGGLLHPARRPVAGPPPATCQTATFAGEGVSLRGWQCRASTVRRGTLIYLHGVADNRMSGAGLVNRFGKRGLDVVAYDSRAHGESDGEMCTYGFFEKQDLSRVLDTVVPGPIVLVGTSLGAAVALQTASEDPRVTAVGAAEVFSELRTVVSDRAPFFLTSGLISQAIRLAERRGDFEADAVSPILAAPKITVPVLLVHGESDVHTPPEHSRRVFAALRGERRLIIVPRARHNDSLRGEVWSAIENWVDNVLGPRPG